MTIKDPRIPKSYEKAMTIPEWCKAIETELEKFRTHNCLIMAIYDGQHLVPMKWIFSIKTDGTYKARLVGCYLGLTSTLRRSTVVTSSIKLVSIYYCIKLVLTIAASYKLRMRGGDLVGAYLVTRANKDYPVFIKTSKGIEVPPGMCIQSVGNLYGFPPAGQNFSIEFDKCVKEMGYDNTPWDLKLFFKWVNRY